LRFGNSWKTSCWTNGLGRGGTTAWPPHSPDFSPLHFYLWRHLKSTVRATEVSEVQELQQRIQNGFDMIRTTPGIFFGESNSQGTNVQRPALKLKFDTFCIHYFLLYCGAIVPSVGLDVNFSLTLYIIYISWKYIEYFLSITWFLDCIHRLMFQRYTPSSTGKNSSLQRSRIISSMHFQAD
jgi:hypothetical protein